MVRGVHAVTVFRTDPDQTAVCTKLGAGCKWTGNACVSNTV
jgi:hypothetical protein